MEPPLKRLNRQSTSRKCCIYSIIALILTVLILVIAIPLAVLLRKKNENVVAYTGPGVSTSLIVPLYIYPGDGAWDPLYQA